MGKRTEPKEKRVTVRCNFDKGLSMPMKCVSCNTPIVDKKVDVTAYTRLHTSKAIFKFPVCENCYQAKQQYVDLKPVIIIGSLAFLLSIYTIIFKPAYLHIPQSAHIIGGLIWLAILVGWMIWSINRARKQNSLEIVTRRNQLKESVKPLKLVTPRRFRSGEVVFTFTNSAFARELLKLNKGKQVK